MGYFLNNIQNFIAKTHFIAQSVIKKQRFSLVNQKLVVAPSQKLGGAPPKTPQIYLYACARNVKCQKYTACQTLSFDKRGFQRLAFGGILVPLLPRAKEHKYTLFHSGIFVHTKLVLDIGCNVTLPELPAGATGWVQAQPAAARCWNWIQNKHNKIRIQFWLYADSNFSFSYLCFKRIFSGKVKSALFVNTKAHNLDSIANRNNIFNLFNSCLVKL